MNSTLKLTADSAVTLLTQQLTFAANVSLLTKMQLAELVGKPPIYTKHVTFCPKIEIKMTMTHNEYTRLKTHRSLPTFVTGGALFLEFPYSSSY